MWLNLLLVAILIALTAFFVATEFAIVRLRSTRVDQMVMEQRKNALAVQRVVSNLDGYLSACQLGITITALGLGWLGEPTVERALSPLFLQWNLQGDLAHGLSFIIAFLIITYLHVVLGELAPKTLAIQKAEEVSLVASPIIILFYKVMYPLIWVLNGSANGLVGLFGLHSAGEHEEAHSEEEIRLILSESYESGKINKTEFGYVSNIFTFDQLMAKEIMVPRTDMVCLYENLNLMENMAIIKREQYTRFPVAKENKDNIIGIINTKQFFMSYDCESTFQIADILQPILRVPETLQVKSLLKKMQQERVHIALLVDEYGGTSGLITIEDILEEIVGEIRDEFDEDERVRIEKLGEGHYLVDGVVLVQQLEQLFNVVLDHDEVDTIGGWIYQQQPDIGQGEAFVHGNLRFHIKERTANRIRRIEIAREQSDTPK